MRVLNLPALPAAAVSGENWMEVYWERYTASLIPWPRVSASLMAYLAWPNDEERRNSFIATCLTLFKLADEAPPNWQELARFGGVAAIAKAAFIPLLGEIMRLERKWLEVAEIFQLIVDMAFDDHAILRRGPSISKAIDLCELESGLRGHSQLRQSWSEFRDVAHLLAAAAGLRSTFVSSCQERRGSPYPSSNIGSTRYCANFSLRPAGLWINPKVNSQRAAVFAIGQSVANTFQSRTGKSVCDFP